MGNALVKGRAKVSGSAVVGCAAVVDGNAVVGEDARVGGYARVTDEAIVQGRAHVSDFARVEGVTLVGDCATVSGNAVVGDCATVGGRATVGGYAVVREFSEVYGDSVVDGDAIVGGYTCTDSVNVRGDAAGAIDDIKEALNRLFEGERRIAGANPGYDAGLFGRRLIEGIERALVKACCRTESGRRAAGALYGGVTGVERVADALDRLDEAVGRKEVRFGAVRECPESGLWAAAACEPRIKGAVRARLAEVGRDVRLRDLPAEEQAAWRAKTRAEKRAANQAAAEKARMDGVILG